MPPKGDGQAKAQKKADLAKKTKALEDKTFGLKNKNKSAKVQNYVETMKKSLESSQKNSARLALLDPNSKEAKAKKKADEEARQRELNEIFVATIKQPKVPAGVDPKSVLCEFFRKGTCAKGFKCKFSHDLAVERKGAKIDLFSDRREGGGEDDGTMEDWDQEKLEAAIARKHGTDNHNRPTEIICKHFLEAIEKKQYGWFWVCPGGGAECKYRHALPPGYVLKSQIKALAAEAAANKMDIVDEIEAARASVAAVTPVTEAVFAAWKAKRAALKAAEKAAAAAERHKAGRLSGRELTELGGFTFEDDLEAGDSASYAREDDMEEAFRQAAVQAAAQLEAARMKALGGAAAAPGQAALDAALLEEDDDLAALQDALEQAELSDGDGDGGGGARGGDSESEEGNGSDEDDEAEGGDEDSDDDGGE